MKPLLLLICCALGATSVHADSVVVSRKIIYPNGSPATKVDVLVRDIIDRNSNAAVEKIVQTGDDGVFTAQLEVPKSPFCNGFILVKAPGYATAFTDFVQNPTNTLGPPPNPLTLVPSADIHGTVKDPDNKAVPNATVEILYFNSWVVEKHYDFNSPKKEIKTPWFQATTDANGNYSLPSVSFNGGPPNNASFEVEAWADISKDGTTTRFVCLPQPLKVDANNSLDFALSVTKTFQGHVFNALTKAPVPDATVELRGRSIGEVPLGHTDKDGAWEIRGVLNHLNSDQIFALVSAPNYATNSLRVSGQGSWLDPKPDPKAATDPTISLLPLVEVSGALVDAVSGEPIHTIVHLLTPNTTIFDDGEFSVTVPGREATVGYDGHFKLRAPTGAIQLHAYGEGYNASLTVDVPGEGVHDLKLPLPRESGVLVQFVSKNPQRLKNVNIYERSTGEGAFSPPTVDYLFFDQGDIKKEVEIRLTRTDPATHTQTEVVPWTKISADQKSWPLVINVP